MNKITLIFFFILSLVTTSAYSGEITFQSSHGASSITMSKQECVEYTEKIFNDLSYSDIKTNASDVSGSLGGYSVVVFCVSEKEIVFYYALGESSKVGNALLQNLANKYEDILWAIP